MNLGTNLATSRRASCTGPATSTEVSATGVMAHAYPSRAGSIPASQNPEPERGEPASRTSPSGAAGASEPRAL